MPWLTTTNRTLCSEVAIKAQMLIALFFFFFFFEVYQELVAWVNVMTKQCIWCRIWKTWNLNVWSGFDKAWMLMSFSFVACGSSRWFCGNVFTVLLIANDLPAGFSCEMQRNDWAVTRSLPVLTALTRGWTWLTQPQDSSCISSTRCENLRRAVVWGAKASPTLIPTPVSFSSTGWNDQQPCERPGPPAVWFPTEG